MKPINFLLNAILMVLVTGCNSVISTKTDEQAWREYFSELNKQQSVESRSIASSDLAADAKRPAVEILRKIVDDLPFRDYLINCENQECYQSKLVIAFDEAFRRVKDQAIVIDSNEYKVEQQRFLGKFSYERMHSQVEAFHHMMLSGVELRASQRAAVLANECENTLNSNENNQIGSFEPYYGGSTYLPRAVFNCLNKKWPEELDELLNETANRLGVVISTAEAKKFIIQKQISPTYRKTLNELFVKRKNDETNQWVRDWPSIAVQIDWKKPIAEVVQNEVSKQREKYRFLNLEALITEGKPSGK